MHLNDFNFTALKCYRRVILCLRDDHSKKPGGDVDLARSLRRLIEDTGVTAQLATIDELDNITSDDAIIIFNIDRPVDALRALQKIPASVRVFIYSLYHPKLGSQLYIRSLTGFRGLLAKALVFNVNRYESFLELLRSLRRRSFLEATTSFRRSKSIRLVIERCELMVVSDQELRDITDSYGPSTRSAWRLPHPVESQEAADQPASIRYIVLAGRIEPRKNQLQLIKFLNGGLLDKTGLKLVVVGGPGSDKVYFQQTIDLCHSTGTVYVSHLPKDIFFKLLAQATLVINGSYVEVTSLIDLAAIEMGVPVISTKYSYYANNPDVLLVDPSKWTSMDTSFMATIEQFVGSRTA